MTKIFLSIPFEEDEEEMGKKIQYYIKEIERYFWEVFEEDTIVLHAYGYKPSDEKSKFYGLSKAIYLMGMCDYVCMVGNWHRAEGCLIEVHIAATYDIPIIYETNQGFCIM